MDLTSRAGTLAPPRLGRILLVAFLVLALAAIALLAIGSRPNRFPPPFGLARNGTLVASADGDIYVLDPVTYERTPLIAGPTADFGPVFSRDGTRFSFVRAAPADCGTDDCGLILMVANADGTGVRPLTTGVPGLDGLDWSPDGSMLAIVSAMSDGQGHSLDIVNADGTGMRTLDVGRPVHLPVWMPPDGREILVMGEGDSNRGIFAVRADGSGMRELTTRPPIDANDFKDSGVSPDGTLVGYRGDDGPGGLERSHVLDLRTGEDRVLPGPVGAAQGAPLFSPDGQTVVYVRSVGNPVSQLVAAPADGSSEGLPIGSREPADGEGINNVAFTPDGKAVVANYAFQKEARLVPVDGSPSTVLLHGELAFAGYQRLAP